MRTFPEQHGFLKEDTLPPCPSRKILAKARGAWLLMEVVIALAVFSAAVVSFVVALNQTAEVSLLAQSRSHVWRLLEGAVMEAMTEPELYENAYQYKLDELSMNISVTVTPLELQTQDSTELSDMWLIVVNADWIQDGEVHTEKVEVWRYGKMYQP